MIGNLFVIDIPGFGYILKTAFREDFFRQFPDNAILFQTSDIFMDFFRYRRRKHPRIRPRIGRQLFFIKLLCDTERLVRTDLEEFGTVIL